MGTDGGPVEIFCGVWRVRSNSRLDKPRSVGRGCEHAGLLARDAELVVDEEFDGGFVDLADEDGAVEAADGDLVGAEGSFHGVGAVADEREESFALTLGGVDGEGDVDEGNVGEVGRLNIVDEFAEGSGGGEGVGGAVQSGEDADGAAEERAAAVGAAAAKEGEAGVFLAAADVEAEGALVELEERGFGDGGFEETDGVAHFFGLAGVVFFAAGNGNGRADVVGGLDEGDGSGALGLKRDGDDAGDGAAGERGGGQEGGE